jgi:hypothetical protein
MERVLSLTRGSLGYHSKQPTRHGNVAEGGDSLGGYTPGNGHIKCSYENRGNWEEGQSNIIRAFGRVLAMREKVQGSAYEKLAEYLATGVMKELWTEAEKKFVKRNWTQFFLQDGVLWRRTTGWQPVRVVLDKGEQKQIVTELHSGEGAGHRIEGATIAKVSQSYWWPKMRRTIVEFVRTCDTCQRFSPRRMVEPLTMDRPPPLLFMKWFWHIVYMPTGCLFRGIDALSRWPEGKEFQSRKAKGLVSFIVKEVIPRYGCMMECVIDGREMDAKVIYDEMDRMGVKFIRVIYHIGIQPEGQS